MKFVKVLYNHPLFEKNNNIHNITFIELNYFRHN